MVSLDPKLKNWLTQQIMGWKKKNIITDYEVKGILNEYGIKYEIPKEKPVNIIRVLMIIGAILLGIGVILFVASNWSKMPALAKTCILLLTTFVTFYLGYFFSYQRKSMQNLGQSLFFLASLFYGGSTFLIAQIYQVNANASWLVLFWAASILPVAYFFKSIPTYLLSTALFALWGITFTASNHMPNYFYPLILFALLIPLAKGKEEHNIPNYLGLALASIGALAQNYQWLTLEWAAGAMAYYLFARLVQGRKNYFATIASGLFVLWNISFFISHHNLPNYFQIIPLAVLFYIAYKEKDQILFLATTAGAIIWINLLVFTLATHYSHLGRGAAMTGLLFNCMLGVCIYLLGKLHDFLKMNEFATTLKATGAIIAALLIYVLSFKMLLKGIDISDKSLYFFAAIASASAAAIALVFNIALGTFKKKGGLIELVGAALIIVLGTIAFLQPANYALNTFLFNTLLFGLAVAAIIYGFDTQNPAVFNMGIFLFVIAIITRYFDLFWGLFSRSLFFIGGGIVLLGAGILLEKKRRATIEMMKSK